MTKLQHDFIICNQEICIRCKFGNTQFALLVNLQYIHFKSIVGTHQNISQENYNS